MHLGPRFDGEQAGGLDFHDSIDDMGEVIFPDRLARKGAQSADSPVKMGISSPRDELNPQHISVVFDEKFVLYHKGERGVIWINGHFDEHPQTILAGEFEPAIPSALMRYALCAPEARKMRSMRIPSSWGFKIRTGRVMDPTDAKTVSNNRVSADASNRSAGSVE
jgi:hypothetical protein